MPDGQGQVAGDVREERHELIGLRQRAVHADQGRLVRLSPGGDDRIAAAWRGYHVTDPRREPSIDGPEPPLRDRLLLAGHPGALAEDLAPGAQHVAGGSRLTVGVPRPGLAAN